MLAQPARCPDDSLLRNGRDAALAADPAYVALLEAQSTWPGTYVFGTTAPRTECAAPLWGANRAHVGPGQVGGYNALLASHGRVDKRASQHRLQTELFGTAPLKTQREWNAAAAVRLRGDAVSKENARVLTEYELARRDYVQLPAPLVQLPETRLGGLTRVGPEYYGAGFVQPRA